MNKTLHYGRNLLAVSWFEKLSFQILSKLQVLLIKDFLILIKSVGVVSSESDAIMSSVIFDPENIELFKWCTKHGNGTTCLH